MIDTLFAASIHEIKNRFGLMLNELDGLLEGIGLRDDQQQSVAHVRHEAQFIGSELVRVLSIFKSAHGQMQAVIDQQFVEDFLEDVVARHTTTARATGTAITFDCDSNLTGFFDPGIVTIILDTCLYNAIKAGATGIILRADEEEGQLFLRVDDNGPGFPEGMAEQFNGGEQGAGHLDLASRSTGLGLFFAQQLIAAHAEADHRGAVRLGQSPEGGARVSLVLPQ